MVLVVLNRPLCLKFVDLRDLEIQFAVKTVITINSCDVDCNLDEAVVCAKGVRSEDGLGREMRDGVGMVSRGWRVGAGARQPLTIENRLFYFRLGPQTKVSPRRVQRVQYLIFVQIMVSTIGKSHYHQESTCKATAITENLWQR